MSVCLLLDCAVADDDDSDGAAEDIQVTIDNGTSSSPLLSNGLDMSDNVAETEVLVSAIFLSYRVAHKNVLWLYCEAERLFT